MRARRLAAPGRSLPAPARDTSGQKLPWWGDIELTGGDPAAAERLLREGFEVFHAMGEQGLFSSFAGLLAEALYRQGRLDEAQRMTEEAQIAAPPDDIDAHVRWRAARAKLLARHGQFPAARRLADEALALIPSHAWPVLYAQTLTAKAEVNRLAGAPDQAKASLHEALRIYEDRHAVPLAEETRAALASLAAQPGSKPALAAEPARPVAAIWDSQLP